MPRAATHAGRAAAGGTGPPAVAIPPRRPAGTPRRSPRSSARAAAARSPAVPARHAAPGRRIARAAGAQVLRLPVRSANGLLDGALRGRAWVALIAALLVGIVFLNVSLLQLNGEIARMSDQAAELKRRNSDLRGAAARLGSTERILRRAERQGFRMPAPGAVTYLEVDPDRDPIRAARALVASPVPAGKAPETAADPQTTTAPPGAAPQTAAAP